SNALSSSATTVISVTDVDRAPVVTVPAIAPVAEAGHLTLTVRAADPDGQPISSLTADLSALPAGNDAVFTVGPGDTTGTLAWTPTYQDSGSYSIHFTAANARSGAATTLISVSNVDRAPTVEAIPTEATSEGSPVSFKIRAVDPDGDAIGSL